MRTTLFVAGFGSRTRARDLAYEFERYGRLVRCDIPAPKTYHAKLYAFVEYEHPRDAEDAFNEMHGRRFEGYTISVQWARNAPSASWRFGAAAAPPPPPPAPLRHRSPPSPGMYRRQYYRSPSRGRSPLRYSRSPPPLPLSRSRSPVHRYDSLSPKRSHSRTTS